MNRKEVWLAEIPGSNGREQRGTRPVLVLSAPVANTIIVVPCTSNQEALRYPGTVALSPNKYNGLTKATVALAFQIRAIDKRRMLHRQGLLSRQDHERIMVAINELLSN